MSDFLNKWPELSAEKLKLAKVMLREEGISFNSIPIVPLSRQRSSFPLSHGQQRLWFLNELMPGNPLYNTPFTVKITGALQRDILEKSLNEIIRRHQVLRTVFRKENKEPVQEILPKLELPIDFEDLRSLSAPEANAQIVRQAQQEARFSFDLTTGPLLRFKLLQIRDDEFIFLLTMHHIVSDGWSTGVFLNELVTLYQAYSESAPSLLPDLPIQYADYAVWQKTWLDDDALQDQIAYWKEQLKDIPDLIDLPTDHPRPAFQTANGSTYSFIIDPELSRSIDQLVTKFDVTRFMFLVATFQTLLYRYSGQEDFTVGTPVANRNRSEIEGLIGFFINSLVLRANFSGNPTFVQYLQQVKLTTLAAFSNQDVSFEKLVEILQPARDTGYSPLFQVMFVLHNAPLGELAFSGLKLEALDIERGTAKFDLILNIFEEEKQLKGTLEFNTDLFDRDTIVRMAGHYRLLLHSIIASPEIPVSRLNILSAEERSTILNEWAGRSAVGREDLLIHQLITEQAQLNPDKTALRCLDEQLSYNEMDKRANRLANYLLEQGIGQGSKIGVCLSRSVDMVVSLLAVLKGGWVFVPLDPEYPQERLTYIIEDAQLQTILSKSGTVSRLPDSVPQLILLDEQTERLEQVSNTVPEIKVNGADPAYIIYTSGSTGLPKGVLISHQSIAGHCRQTAKIYEVTPEDRYLQFAAINFDAALEQIFTPLISGAQLILRENEIWPTSDFHKKMIRYDLTVINLPTPYWEQLSDEWNRNPDLIPDHSLRLVIVGGDALHRESVKGWRDLPLGPVRLLNAYGPTETTITASLFELGHDKSDLIDRPIVPIGKPLPNRKFYVLDEHGNPVPGGIPGELHIGGDHLAIGYLNQPKLTEDRFIPDPFSTNGNGRLYKTGDLVRWLKDGNLEFLGRKDDQVKIRGFRIELGEIEFALNQHPGVRYAVVTVRENAGNQKQLIAYIKAPEQQPLTFDEMRAFLSKKLPDYMIPTAVVNLSDFPQTPSGKIDKKLLPAPDQIRPDLAANYVAPRTPVEEKLAQLTAEILGVERVGVYDNFFDLGGHSMLAIKVISQIREEFQVEIGLRQLFEEPHVAGLSRAITELQAEQVDETELEKMLADLEQLSDDEARELLNH